MKIKGISMLFALALMAFTFSITIANAVESDLSVFEMESDDTAVEVVEIVVDKATTTNQIQNIILQIDGEDVPENNEEEFNIDLEEETTLILEDTAELCADGIDNDENGNTDLGDENCADLATVVPVLVLENTFALCHDSLDNDENGNTDLGDENCANHGTDDEDETTLVLENTAVLCADGIDNDENGNTDLGDENCAPFITPVDNGGDNNDDENDNESNNNNRSSRSGQRKSSNRPSSEGEVLGAFTGSCPFLTTYMRIGQSNDAAEVTKLQEFLNSDLGITLPTTGFFGQLTHDAVNAFQLKYKDSVLLPWVEAGLMENKEVPTGYVYKTTLHTINKIVCPEMDVAKPVLN